jgi:hypothetical protein
VNKLKLKILQTIFLNNDEVGLNFYRLLQFINSFGLLWFGICQLKLYTFIASSLPYMVTRTKKLYVRIVSSLKKKSRN